MGISVEWFDVEQTIIYQRIRELFAWDDFHAQDTTIKAMIASVTHPVCMVVDVQDFSMRNAPGGVLTHIRMTMPGFPDNLTCIVVIADTIFGMSLFKMVQRLGFIGPGCQFHVVNSLEEAQTFLDISWSKG